MLRLSNLTRREASRRLNHGHHFDDYLLHAPITDQHPSPNPHHSVPPVPPRRHVLLLQHRDPEPYAALMTHVGRWNLVERTPADIEADVRAAAPPGTVAGLDITADATGGLTLFVSVRRADEPG